MSAVATPTPGGLFLLRAVRSLIWQQLKVTQALRYLVIGGIVGLQWVMPLLFKPHNTHGPAIGASLLLILAFALIAPSLVLAAEWESRTRSRRLMLPTSWWVSSGLLACLGLANMILFAVISAVNWYLVTGAFEIQAVALPFDYWLQHPAETLVFGTLFVLAAFGFGILGAAWGRNMRTGICISVGAFIVLTNVAILGNWTGDRFPGLAVFVLPTLLAIDIWSLRRWFHASENSVFTVPSIANTRCPERLVTSRPRSRAWHDVRLLVWHERATSRLWWLGASAVVMATAATVFGHRALSFLLCLGVILGALVFQSEKTASRFRFLSHRGISPTAVWLSHHLVWLPRLAISLTVGLAGLWYFSDPDFVEYLRPARGNIIAAAIALYAFGQAISMCVRRLHVVLAVALVVAVLFVAWWRWVIMLLEVPGAVSMLTVVPGLLWVSWRRCHTWLDERKPGWRPLIGALASMAMTYCSVAVYRATEIPDADDWYRLPSEPMHEKPRSVIHSGEAHRNATKLLAIGKKLVNPQTAQPTMWRLDRPPIRWEQTDVATRLWALRNEELVKDTLAAIKPGSFFFDSRLPESYAQVWMHETSFVSYSGENTKHGQHQGSLFTRYAPLLLLELHGAKAESEGDVDRAADLYLAAMRGYWKTMSSDRPGPDLLVAYAAAGHLCRRIGRLAADHANNGSGRWLTLITELKQTIQQRPTLSDANARHREICLELASQPAANLREHPQFESGEITQPFRGQRWLAPVGSWTTRAPDRPDLFTNGLRERQLINWLWRRNEQLIAALTAAYKPIDHLRNHLGDLEKHWPFHEHQAGYTRTTPSAGRYVYSFNPIDCLYAEFDLQTDLAAAEQMTSLGRTKTGALDPSIKDPWTGKAFELVLTAAGDTIRDAGGSPIPEGTPVLRSAGSLKPASQYESRYDPDILGGGSRYYIPPSSLVASLREGLAEQAEAEKSD